MVQMKFTQAMLEALTLGVAMFPGASEELRNQRFTVQSVLPNGRINVKFERDGFMQYRTFAARDLQQA
jgi:hypothetical protein